MEVDMPPCFCRVTWCTVPCGYVFLMDASYTCHDKDCVPVLHTECNTRWWWHKSGFHDNRWDWAISSTCMSIHNNCYLYITGAMATGHPVRPWGEGVADIIQMYCLHRAHPQQHPKEQQIHKTNFSPSGGVGDSHLALCVPWPSSTTQPSF